MHYRKVTKSPLLREKAHRKIGVTQKSIAELLVSLLCSISAEVGSARGSGE